MTYAEKVTYYIYLLLSIIAYLCLFSMWASGSLFFFRHVSTSQHQSSSSLAATYTSEPLQQARLSLPVRA